MCHIFIFPVSTSSSTEQDRSPLNEKCKSILRISRCRCTTPHHHLACTDVSRQQCGLIFKRRNVLEELSETIFQWRDVIKQKKGILRYSEGKIWTLSKLQFLCLYLSVWISFFVSVYRTQPFTLSLFLLSPLISSTQTYPLLLVHPLLNGFPRSGSTRVTTGPVTYSSNWITFTGPLYTNTRSFLTPHISPAVRLPFVSTVIAACACPLGFCQPDLKPHPLFPLMRDMYYQVTKTPFYSGIYIRRGY